MPYFVTDTAEGCAGWATVKEGGEVIGCHDTKDAAVAQMVAVSLSEGIEPGGDYRVLPDNYRPALSPDVPEGRACGNCMFYNEEDVQGDKAWCERWDDYVNGAYYCNAWQPNAEARVDAPAPPSDQITGSDTNEPGSAKGKLGDIELSEATETALQTKSDDHNEEMQKEGRPSWTRVRVDALRAVYRRGAGAYSVSHRPGTTREQWAMARVNAFLFLARTGAPENAAYVGDNDLLNSGHPKFAEAKEENQVRILIDVPQYIQEAAEKGLTYERNGYAGEGLTDQTIEEARQLRAGQVEDDKVTRMRAWILRHRGDWEDVPRNNNPDDEDFPGPGAVAAYLWGVDPTAENGTQRVLEWADGVLAPLETEERFDVKELETRALPMGEFTVTEGEDGQKTFTGYAALFGAPSSGLPFTEVIAPGAFRRTLSRVADGKKIVSFLFGHDETRALATTASGRLALTEDERGLKVEARLDPADPDAAGVISKLTYEAVAMGMSFGFTIPKNGDEWDEDTRTLREVNLFEVSVLSAGQTPAYPATLGLTSVRKVASRMGVDGDRLITAIESLKSATPLTEADVEVIETVTEKLAPKRTGLDSSIARAKLLLAEMESESL
jgi:HK97 family phage prohead protease